MRSLLALALAATVGAPMSAPTSAPPTSVVHTRDFLVQPNGQVQQFNVACEPGEELIGGGYSAQSDVVEVVGSYPSGVVWSVQALYNRSKEPAKLQVEANCVVGSTGKTTVMERKGETPSAAVQCPEGTVLTGGGYLTGGTRSTTAYVMGSHPMGDNGWGIDAEPPVIIAAALRARPAAIALAPQAVEVFAVCHSGVREDVQIGLAKFPGEPYTATCPSGQTLSSFGYEVSDGKMQPYAVQKATTNLLAVNADPPIAVKVTALCLTWPTPATPTTTASVNWPLVAGGGLLVLLALVLAYRMRSRRARLGGGFDVVVRSEEGGFGLDRLREVP